MTGELMDEIEKLSESLNQLISEDEIDGRFVPSALIQKIRTVINITSKILNHLVGVIRSCTKGEQLAERAEQLADITSTVVNLTELIIRLSDTNKNPRLQS